VFSLVEKDRNFVQLRNQIDNIQAANEEIANVFKAMKEAFKEFKDNARSRETNKWIVVFANTSGVGNKRVSLSDVCELLKCYKANLIVIGFDLDHQSRKVFEQLCQEANESRFIENPTEETIGETFQSIANYKFQHRTLILETFN